MRRFVLLANLFFVPCVLAATTLDVNPVTKKLDLILDVSNIGTITGVSATFTSLNCTGNANGGAITGDAAGNLQCSDDNAGSSNSFETWDIPLGGDVVADSDTDTVTFTSTGPVVIFGTTSSDSIAWNLNDASLTEVMLKVVDAAADEECLTYEGTGGDFEWQTCGSGGNSFETWAVPEGTSIVADSSTDTATFTSTGPIVVFGIVASDSVALNIHDNGITAAMIADNAVALGTDTTGNYTTSVAEGLAIDVSGAVGEGQEAVVAFDPTELTGNRTFDDGATSTQDIWTWNLSSGTDPTMTFFDNRVTVTGILVGSSTLDGGSAFQVIDTDPDLTSDTYLIDLSYADDSDAQAHFLRARDGSGTELLITSDGEIVIGSTTVDAAADLDIYKNSSEGASRIHLTTAQEGSSIQFQTSDGSVESPTIIPTGEIIGNLYFYGHDNTNYENAATIRGLQDQDYAPGNNDMAGRLDFYTTPDGSTNDALVMTMNGDQNITVGSSYTDLGKFAIDGNEDETQFLVQANATQTSPLFVVEKSTGTNLAEVTATGVLVVGANTATGVLVLTSDQTIDRTIRFTPGNLTQDVYYTLPVDDGTSSQVLQTDGGGVLSWVTSSGSDTLADEVKIWPMSALLPLETADSIPPLAKDAGTNIDQLVVDFDQTTDECRTGVYKVHPKINTSGTVNLYIDWYAASVTTNEVIWDFRHNGGVAEGTDPDAALTTVASAADTVQGTAGLLTVTNWTETVSNLGWAANEEVDFEVCRDANNAGDDFAADARARKFVLRIPLTP